MKRKKYIKMQIKIAYSLIVALTVSNLTFAQKKDSVTNVQKSFLKELIPTAYGGKVSRAEYTGSLSTVSSEQMLRVNTPSLQNTFIGQLAGLYSKQNAGAPGNNDNPTMYIHGKQTFGDNGFMILVDGFESVSSNLNVNEIESVTVLKDAASLALYGLDGANGVILITTKRGINSPKSIINFNARYGIQSATVLPDYLTNGDYAELYNVAMKSDGKDISAGYFSSDNIVKYFKEQTYPELYPDVNWQNEILKNNAFSQDYSISFKGGNSSVKYFVQTGLANYTGIYGNTDPKGKTSSNYNLRRINIRTNVEADITKNIRAEISIRGTIDDKKYPNVSENDIWKAMGVFLPYPVKVSSTGLWSGKQGYLENPVAAIQHKGYDSNNARTIDANVKLITKLDFITTGLKAYGQINFSNGYFSYFNKNRGLGYHQLTPRPDLQLDPTSPLPFDLTFLGTADKNYSYSQATGTQWNRSTFISGLEYERYFGESKIYASANYLQDKYELDGPTTPYARQRLMGRLRYGLQDKYIAEFGWAYSGSESFPKGKRFGFFPTISSAWVVSNEDFMRNSSVIDLLKIRASYGLLGNDNLGNNRWIYTQYYVGAGNYYIGNNLAAVATMSKEGAIANPFVTWEKSKKANVGVDMILFDKLSVAIDAFNENRTDIFVSPTNLVPAIMGASFTNLNRGSAQSYGFDSELKFSDKIGTFGYYVGGNFSWNENKIIEMEELPRTEEYLNAKGRPIGQPFILEAVGFFKDAADIKDSPIQQFGEVKPGDIKYKDQNDDGFVNDDDRKPIGYPVYPKITYGISAGLSFIGFDCNVFLEGTAQRSVSLLDNASIQPFINGGVKPTQWVKDNYWTPERGDDAKFPRLTTLSNDNNYRASTLWQRDGSFIRLKVVELGYTLPENLTKMVKIDNLRLFVSGNNLFTFHKINEINIDPEIMNRYVYPAMKSINFGITTQF